MRKDGVSWTWQMNLCNLMSEPHLVEDTQFWAGGTFLLLPTYFPPFYHANLSLLCWKVSYKRILQGRGVAAGSTAREAFINSLKWLGDRCTEQLNGIRKTLRVQSKVYVTCGGDQERLLNRQLQRMLSSLGEVLCGDEKLFRGRGGIVRKVPRKPARIGIWHYQAVVMLPTDDPFLAYTSVHNTSTPQEALARARKPLLWTNGRILSFLSTTNDYLHGFLLFVQSGTRNSTAEERTLHCCYQTRLLQKNYRFAHSICSERWKKRLCIHWGQEWSCSHVLVGGHQHREEIRSHKLLHSCTAEKAFWIRARLWRVQKFSGCDKQLYGKNFPYQAPNDTNLAEKKNIWNYLFTSVLINVWNVWKGVLQARDPETETISFRDFCDDLSVRIIGLWRSCAFNVGLVLVCLIVFWW